MGKTAEGNSEAWSSQTIWACLAMAAFAGMIVLAMRMLSPAESAAAPEESAPLVPHTPLTFAVYDMHRHAAADAPILSELGKLRIDFLMLEEIAADQVEPAATAAGMPLPPRPGLYQPSINIDGPGATWGNCILSRHPLLKPSPLATSDGTFGVWARSEMDGISFQLASISPASGPRGEAELDAVRGAGADRARAKARRGPS